MTLAITMWLLVAIIAALVTSLVLAIIAVRPKRHWLAAPGVVVITALIVLGASIDSDPDLWARLPIVGGILALGVVAGSPIVAITLRLASAGTVPAGVHGGILVRDLQAKAPVREKEVLRGGATIGYLERLALIGSVLAGQAAAVAVIVAIKGLGRFSELESAEARERFIIGTLASLVWAGGCSVAAHLWL